ncbi:MAG: hypothetical protein ACI8WB_006225, partial [Phenylobacterium sp.]
VSFSIIKDLLDNGGQLAPNAINWIIFKNNAELARKLLPYGLDIHFISMGDSTLASSVKRRAPDMLKFLIDNGVKMDSDVVGFDALDFALQQVDLKTEGLIYVSTLIAAGAKIELSHKQIVDSMKVNQMEKYFKLTSTYQKLKL